MDVGTGDFVADRAWTESEPPFGEIERDDLIEGVRLRRLVTHEDHRGGLTVLNSTHYDPDFSAVHVYLVEALPGSVRAWVYHKYQSDCLAFSKGRFQVALYDIRPDSPTLGRLNVFEFGAHNQMQLVIPAFVAHGVKNIGTESSVFVNMPTRAYDPAAPDKWRITDEARAGIPFSFD